MKTPWVVRDKRLGFLYLEQSTHVDFIASDLPDATRLTYHGAAQALTRLHGLTVDRFVRVVDPTMIAVCRGKGQRRSRRAR